MLSVVMPYRNEEMLEFTVQRLHETLRVPYEIITIDDGSDQPVTLPAGVKNIRFEESTGVDFARHVGIEAARYDTVLVIDAHMNFWDDDWSVRLVDYSINHPTHVGCVITLGLEPGRLEMARAKGRYFGAHIIPTDIIDSSKLEGELDSDLHYVFARRILVDKWNSVSTLGENGTVGTAGTVSEVGSVLGGAYFMSRKWYLETLMSPWEELRGWGFSEANISIPNFLLGGTNVCLDVEMGHMFRHASPFPTHIHKVLFNELYLAHVVIPYEAERNALIAKLELPDDPVARAAYSLLDRSLHGWYGRYLVEKGTRTWEEYKITWMDPAIHY